MKQRQGRNMDRYTFYVDDRQGNIWQVRIIEAEWNTKQNGEAGKLSFSFIRDIDFDVLEGYVVRFDANDIPIFYGVIFDIKYDETEKGTATAYDQLIYLTKHQASYVFENQTASAILQAICKDYNLDVGVIDPTAQPLTLVHQDKKLSDIIRDALDRTTAAVRRLHTLYDDAGKVCLRELKNMMTDVVLAYGSLVTGYEYSRSISEDVYNNVRLIRKDEEKGVREVFVAKDHENIAKWGSLQYFATVDESLTDAQIQSRLQLIMKLKNRTLRKLSTQSLGDYRARAGAMVYVEFEREKIGTWFLISEAQHKFENQLHTMKLTMFMPDAMEEKT